MVELLKTTGLTKHFTVRRNFRRGAAAVVRAVDGVDLHIRPGETLGLVGESGSGKSTIGRLILRLIEPTAGRIWFQGQEITGLSRRAMRPLRRSMQIIFQDPYSSLDPRMTVNEIIGEAFGRDMHLSRSEKRARILDIMEKVGLRPEHYDRYPHEFSGGQRQRIGIARAVILHPQLIVADEALSALDVSVQAQTVNLLEKLKAEYRLSYLFISHDLSVVEHVSDRIAVMYLGRIVELAPREELYDTPRHPYTISLLSAVPVPKPGGKPQRIVLKGDIPSPLSPPAGCRFHTRCFRGMDVCSQLEPEWKETAPGHFTACHLA